MPQSYTCLHYHFVFSTRHRLPSITPDIKTRLWEYLGGIVKGAGGIPIQIGGTADHVHLLVTLRQEPAIASFMRDLKAASSGWIHDTFPDAADFWWQTGYGAFSVSHSALEESEAVHCESGRAPQDDVVSGRVPGVPDEARHPVRREVSLGVSIGRRSAAPTNAWCTSFPGVPLAKLRSTPGYHRTPLRG